MDTKPTPAASAVLIYARGLIGAVKYSKMDCSHFVNDVYSSAGMFYPYTKTKSFYKLAEGSHAKFEEIKPDEKSAGDIILMPGHMGIYDPQGCEVLSNNAECVRLQKNAPFLSSRTGGNRGPDYGQTSWWGSEYKVFRWKGLQ